MEKPETYNYPPPIDQLLTYGEAARLSPEQWPDYLALGIGPQHIPDLIRMATDIDLDTDLSDSPAVWAPHHAWRTLGQLRAVEAIEPLLSYAQGNEEVGGNDWLWSELPEIASLIGPTKALPLLTHYIADIAHSTNARALAIECVKRIATDHPESRPIVIELLAKQLELFAENDVDLNAALVGALVDLQATETAPLIERAYAARRVDLDLMGDWEDVQINLGLQSAEEVARYRSPHLPETHFSSSAHALALPHVSSKTRYESAAAQRKAKNKMAKQSRKKNRKR